MSRRRNTPIELLEPLLIQLPEEGGLFDFSRIFENDHPVELEIGCGKGLFLLNASAAHPNTNFIGIEIEKKYCLLAASRILRSQRPNVRLMAADAKLLLSQRVDKESLQAIHIYFPDPWWKNRHRKRRLFTSEFIVQVRRTLVVGGNLHFVSDVRDYFEQSNEIISDVGGFNRAEWPEPDSPENEEDYLTNFERKYRKEGRPIFRALYQRT